MIQNKDILNYVNSIKNSLDEGDATEHTHRPTLKTLIESHDSKIKATNEPKRVQCGAPDFRISRSNIPLGHIETKDVNEDLDKIEKTDQLERYFNALPNLILTNYLEFRWYVDGKERIRGRLGWLDRNNKLILDTKNYDHVISILNTFIELKHEIISNPKDLAIRMAKQAKIIRDLAKSLYQFEKNDGQLHQHLQIFGETLIPDLGLEEFCDMFAQTVSYGLFAAKCSTLESRELTREKAGFLVPKTNPFLRKFFNELAGPDLDDSIAWAIDDLVQILNQSNIKKIVEEFSEKRKKDDAVIHFYETFLNEYNPKEKFARGVFYTPFPIIAFIIKSVDQILKKQFGCVDGIAESSRIKIKHESKEQEYHKVLILDPACGTGSFLLHIINEIEDHFKKNRGIFTSYVQDHILPRIYGFELLMAPYAIAHIKMGLRLASMGYNFESDERLRVFLTNTLEDPLRKNEVIFSNWVSKEGNQATEVKRDFPIMVIVGNPPYAAISANKGKWITDLIEKYRYIETEKMYEKKYSLQDDYVKFIRFAQWKIERTGQGILGFITNNNFLDGPTFRAMRYNLLNSFDELRILNLHGSVKRDDAQKKVEKDENVFDIQQGVTIFLFVKNKDSKTRGVYYHEIFGIRESKYSYLLQNDIDSVKWKKIEPAPPYYFFTPIALTTNKNYNAWIKLTDIFEIKSTAIESARDTIAFAFTREEMVERIRQLRDFSVSDDELKKAYGVKDMSFWNLNDARHLINNDQNWKEHIQECVYRPFDKRMVYNSRDLLHRPRTEVMQNFTNVENIGLLCTRQLSSNEFQHVYCTDALSERCALSTKTKEGCYCFPLYSYSKGKKNSNLKREFTSIIEKSLKLKMIEGKGDFKSTVGPYDIFSYIYGILHSSVYRSTNYNMLRYDFAKIPIPPSSEFFKKIGKLGDKLLTIHLGLGKLQPNDKGKFPIVGTRKVEMIKAIPNPKNKNSVDIIINSDHTKSAQFFEAIPLEIWKFKIGSYQVLEKWLSEHKNRILSYDEITSYQKMITAIAQTILVMKEIDEVYKKEFKN